MGDPASTKLRCLTVRQPWASLLVAPTLPKWIETRSRPTNIRGAIGIIAGAHTRDCWYWGIDRGSGWNIPRTTTLATLAGVTLDCGTVAPRGRFAPGVRGVPFGALIGTVDLYDCIPIVEERGCPDAPDCPEGMITVAGPHSGHMGHLTWLTWHHTVNGRDRFINRDRTEDANAQRPYGDFRPGRWAWLTRNPVRFDEPVPMPGSQGWKTIDHA